MQTAEHSEVATIKLSNKNGRPFMTFEIIVKTVLSSLPPCTLMLTQTRRKIADADTDAVSDTE